MCGIAGVIAVAADPSLDRRRDQMVAALSHRGPDGAGVWSGRVGDAHVSLGHRRLAILDLSAAGHQPMLSPCGRHVLVYNGEVYNFKELRQELESAGVRFVTRCDTEVVLHALRVWGPQALKKFNGMWALAWLDLKDSTLLVSRDRFGVKPLYLYRKHDRIYFASEIKALLGASGDRFQVNAAAVGRYLSQSLLDAQLETFFGEVEAFPPGHYAVVSLRGGVASALKPVPYWSAPMEDAFSGGIESRVEAARELFMSSVRLRLRSDVPVGVMLSGGLDSSSIAAAMQNALGKGADLHMLSVVSDDPRYDEQPFIDRMTAHLGCPSHKVKLRSDPHEAFALLSKVIYSNDEPVGNFSSVAYYMAMQHAKELGITVIFSGQGADELLCGYKKYLGFYLQSLVETGHWLGALTTLRDFINQGTVISQFSLKEANRYLPRFLRSSGVDILGPRLRQRDFLVNVGLNGGSVAQRQRADLIRLSVPGLVHYEDRFSMAFSREVRLPFLDYRLVELLLPTAPDLKMRDGWTKWLFRKAMERDLPPEIAWRKDKQSFVNPQERWLKHELREDIEALIGGELEVAKRGFVDQSQLRRLYQAYCRQPENADRIWFKDIFNPIALEFWLRGFDSHLAAA